MFFSVGWNSTSIYQTVSGLFSLVSCQRQDMWEEEADFLVVWEHTEWGGLSSRPSAYLCVSESRTQGVYQWSETAIPQGLMSICLFWWAMGCRSVTVCHMYTYLCTIYCPTGFQDKWYLELLNIEKFWRISKMHLWVNPLVHALEAQCYSCVRSPVCVMDGLPIWRQFAWTTVGLQCVIYRSIIYVYWIGCIGFASDMNCYLVLFLLTHYFS